MDTTFVFIVDMVFGQKPKLNEIDFISPLLWWNTQWTEKKTYGPTNAIEFNSMETVNAEINLYKTNTI